MVKEAPITAHFIDYVLRYIVGYVLKSFYVTS